MEILGIAFDKESRATCKHSGTFVRERSTIVSSVKLERRGFFRFEDDDGTDDETAIAGTGELTSCEENCAKKKHLKKKTF